jgi:hypothetical protein
MPLGEVSSEGSSVADACARGRDDAVSTLRQADVAGLDGAGSVSQVAPFASGRFGAIRPSHRPAARL